MKAWLNWFKYNLTQKFKHVTHLHKLLEIRHDPNSPLYQRIQFLKVVTADTGLCKEGGGIPPLQKGPQSYQLKKLRFFFKRLVFLHTKNIAVYLPDSFPSHKDVSNFLENDFRTPFPPLQ